MSQVYPPNLLTAGARALFFQAVAGLDREAVHSRIARTVPSNKKTENYAYLGESPIMADLDQKELEFTAAKDRNYALTNKTHKAGMVFKREDLEDDQTGLLADRVRQLAGTVTSLKNKIAFDLLINGTSDNCYDGTAYFGNSHADDGAGSTQDNLLTGTGTTTAQVQTDLQSAVSAMAQFLAANGQPFDEDLRQLVVVAPWEIKKPVEEALNASIISNTSNVGLRGLSIMPIFSARLTDANDWYLLNVGKMGVMPLMIQERKAVEFESQTAGEGAMKRDQFEYAARWRGIGGYGPWQLAVKTTNT